MNDLIESLIYQLKQKLFEEIFTIILCFFLYKTLGADKDDKYKHTRASILEYMTQNKNEILLKLIKD